MTQKYKSDLTLYHQSLCLMSSFLLMSSLRQPALIYMSKMLIDKTIVIAAKRHLQGAIMFYHLLCPMFRMPDALEQPGGGIGGSLFPHSNPQPPTHQNCCHLPMMTKNVCPVRATHLSYCRQLLPLLFTLYKWYGMIWLSHAALMIRSQESAYKSEIPLLKSSGPEKA